MKALISPNELVQQITSWEQVDGVYQPVYTVLGLRIAQTSETSFEVAPPLFWVDCADDVTEWYYYSSETQSCIQIPEPAPEPTDTTSESI